VKVSSIRLICAGVSVLLASTAARAQSGAYPPVTIPNTEVRSLHSSITGRDYDLYVYLPARRDTTPGRKVPVLYLLDGQWDFKLLTSIQGGLLYDRYVPDVIVVGITYSGAHANYDSLRAVDYTPAASPNNPGSGDAARFLSFLERELMPFVERSYPADPSRRALMGSSLGGLFTLYAMFSRPGLFSGYAAGSPAVTYANRGAFADEAAYAANHPDLPTRLYVAVGSEETLAAPVAELVRTLRARGYAGLTLESRVIEGERHSGNKPEAFNRGLRFLFGN
jgi:predicted alpha/beta superfamily hydrolase